MCVLTDTDNNDAKPLIAKLDSFNLKEKWTGGKTLSQYCGSLIDNLKRNTSKINPLSSP
jgi:hypothetical protein